MASNNHQIQSQGVTEENMELNDVTVEENIVCRNAETHTFISDRSPDEMPPTCCFGFGRCLFSARRRFVHHYDKNKANILHLYKWLFLLAYLMYVGYCVYYKFGDEGSIRLVTLTGLVMMGCSYAVLKKFCRNRQVKISTSRWHLKKARKKLLKRLIHATAVIGVVAFLVFDVGMKRPEHLKSAMGMVILLLLMFMFSTNPENIKWRTVFWGIMLQFIFGLIVLRTSWGILIFQWIADQFIAYFKHADAGGRFVFGDNFEDHFIAFKLSAIIVLSSSTISILYYLGWMQVAMRYVASIMEVTMGTSAVESLHAALNVFLGLVDALIAIRPFVGNMTMSEIHAVCANGLATVAASSVAIYSAFGASAHHLLSASIMSAPAALAVSKLFYPEDQRKGQKVKNVFAVKSTDNRLMDAISAGATSAISMLAQIMVNLLAMISLLDVVNSALTWFGERAGLSPPEYPPLTFNLISSYAFWPLSFIMGVDVDDCFIVGRLLGTKLFATEFIAFLDLGNIVRNRNELTQYNGTLVHDVSGNILLEATNTTLIGGVISFRSEMIVTYALCGFSNLATVGMIIGGFSAIAPNRKSDIVKVAMRSLISGSVACFLTATMAGLVVGSV